MVVLRPILKSYSKPVVVARAVLPLEPEEEAAKEAAKEISGYEKQVDLAKQIARDDPKKVAQVVKEWVSSDGK
jgi:flagellar M-ring protein FliF